MNEQEELAALKLERRELLFWFASRIITAENWKDWKEKDSRLEEIHRRIDEITGEPKFHR